MKLIQVFVQCIKVHN